MCRAALGCASKTKKGHAAFMFAGGRTGLQVLLLRLAWRQVSYAIDEMELPLYQGTSLLLILTSFTLRTTSNSLDLDLLCMELETLLRVENRI